MSWCDLGSCVLCTIARPDPIWRWRDPVAPIACFAYHVNSLATTIVIFFPLEPSASASFQRHFHNRLVMPVTRLGFPPLTAPLPSPPSLLLCSKLLSSDSCVGFFLYKDVTQIVSNFVSVSFHSLMMMSSGVNHEVLVFVP